MFLCHWYKLQVKDHEDESEAKPMKSAIGGYLRREFLMVLHHVVMVTVCFPVSVVSGLCDADALILIITHMWFTFFKHDHRCQSEQNWLRFERGAFGFMTV